MANKTGRRIAREKKTITAMVSLFCKHHHRPNGLTICENCKTIQDYAIKRLCNCPFFEKKPTCTKCLIHCYKKDMQEKVRRIMRYSGPRLFFLHPVLAICHILDGRIKPQRLKKPVVNDPSRLNEKPDGNVL